MKPSEVMTKNEYIISQAQNITRDCLDSFDDKLTKMGIDRNQRVTLYLMPVFYCDEIKNIIDQALIDLKNQIEKMGWIDVVCSIHEEPQLIDKVIVWDYIKVEFTRPQQ